MAAKAFKYDGDAKAWLMLMQSSLHIAAKMWQASGIVHSAPMIAAVASKLADASLVELHTRMIIHDGAAPAQDIPHQSTSTVTVTTAAPVVTVNNNTT
jgi:hypothetical protein